MNLEFIYHDVEGLSDLAINQIYNATCTAQTLQFYGDGRQTWSLFGRRWKNVESIYKSLSQNDPKQRKSDILKAEPLLERKREIVLSDEMDKVILLSLRLT